ncbi:hypothetical protein GCM10027174_09740 [Salinifilum aidingensis]
MCSVEAPRIVAAEGRFAGEGDPEVGVEVVLRQLGDHVADAALDLHPPASGGFLLTPVVRKVIKDYDHQRRTGLDPVFDPNRLGIRGADYWEGERAAAATVSGVEKPEA